MRNYKKHLDALKKAIGSKVARVVFLDFKDGQYFHKRKKVDITKINADVLIIDDIPDEPEKEGEGNCPEKEFQTNS